MSSEAPVLVGIDGSRDGLIALTWAESYAALHKVRLHAMYLVDDHREPPDDGREVLDDARATLDRLGFTAATFEVRHGHPAQVLLEEAENSSALVVGRRGRGGFAELVLGSTSQVCTALSTKVPLIVVPDTWDPEAPAQGRIVVGIDGSLEGQDALLFAFELAGATNTELLGVHAIEAPGTHPDPTVTAEPVRQPWADVADELLTQTMDGWHTKFPEVRVQQRQVTDHPVMVLARESEHADLVVVGGVGHTAFSEMRLGSVARGLLHHSCCPVAVVHHLDPAHGG